MNPPPPLPELSGSEGRTRADILNTLACVGAKFCLLGTGILLLLVAGSSYFSLFFTRVLFFYLLPATLACAAVGFATREAGDGWWAFGLSLLSLFGMIAIANRL